MSATQHEAFRRFVEKNLSADPLSSIFRGQTAEESIKEVATVIEPFLMNPERHGKHIIMVLKVCM
jgi:hypothetical protein